MPQVRIESRNFTETNKCDAVAPKYVNFEIGDESPPNTFNFPTDFFGDQKHFQNGFTFSDGGRKVVKDKDCTTHVSLSVLTDGKQCSNQEEENNCDLDVNLRDLLNSDFSNFGGKCSTVTSGVGLPKFKSNCSRANNRETNTNQKFLKSAGSSNFLPSIPFCEQQIQKKTFVNGFLETNKFSKDTNMKLKTEDKSKGPASLSDLLTSISICDEKSEIPSFGKNLLDSNKCNDTATDIPNFRDLYEKLYNSNCSLNAGKKYKNGFSSLHLKAEENLSDIFSSIDIHELEPTTKSVDCALFDFEQDQTLTNISSDHSKELEKQNFSYFDVFEESVINDISSESDSAFNIDVTTSSKSECTLSPSYNKSNEFFFDQSSKDMSLNEVFTNVNDVENTLTNSNNEDSDFNMLDLLKSVNHASKESANSLHGNKDKNSQFNKNIDLTACLKITEDTPELELLNQTVHDINRKNICNSNQMCPEADVISNAHVEFSPKPQKMNLKQSLFAKCLQCKPKKNIKSLQKVALLKRKMMEDLFYPEMSLVLPSKTVDLVFLDESIFTNVGRNMFGFSTSY